MSKTRDARLHELHYLEWSNNDYCGAPHGMDKASKSFLASLTDHELLDRLTNARMQWKSSNTLRDLGKTVCEAGTRRFNQERHYPGVMYWNEQRREAIWHFSSLPDRTWDDGRLPIDPDLAIQEYSSLAESILTSLMLNTPGVGSAKASLERPEGKGWVRVKSYVPKQTKALFARLSRGRRKAPAASMAGMGQQ